MEIVRNSASKSCTIHNIHELNEAIIMTYWRLLPLSLLFVVVLEASIIGFAQDAEATEDPNAVLGEDLTIEYLRTLEIEGSEIQFHQELDKGSNYSQYIISYLSEGYRIRGLLAVPFGIAPEGGFKAIVFNHGYIPPNAYRTTERYVDYVRVLAEAGFVVFKIDMRGHGTSEGESEGTYFSPGYTIDAISAVKSLQLTDFIDPNGIGLWGHSMSGNLVLRAMLLEPDIKAGVIWAGAVYSYDDFAKYSITDPSFNPSASTSTRAISRGQQLREAYGPLTTETPFWKSVSLTEHIDYLESPIQLHHAVDDPIVNIDYAYDLANVLEENDKLYEIHAYQGGGHNIGSPSFNEAMRRTVIFFRQNL
jgi:uncharacterized protein